jgi:hypothetical protein
VDESFIFDPTDLDIDVTPEVLFFIFWSCQPFHIFLLERLYISSPWRITDYYQNYFLYETMIWK